MQAAAAVSLNHSIEMGAQFQPCLCLLRALSTISLLLMCVCPTPHSLIFNNVGQLCLKKCQKAQIPNVIMIMCPRDRFVVFFFRFEFFTLFLKMSERF